MNSNSIIGIPFTGMTRSFHLDWLYFTKILSLFSWIYSTVPYLSHCPRTPHHPYDLSLVLWPLPLLLPPPPTLQEYPQYFWGVHEVQHSIMVLLCILPQWWQSCHHQHLLCGWMVPPPPLLPYQKLLSSLRLSMTPPDAPASILPVSFLSRPIFLAHTVAPTVLQLFTSCLKFTVSPPCLFKTHKILSQNPLDFCRFA